MAENKTQKTGASVGEFLASVENKRRREDGLTLLEMMREITGLEPDMWGPSIIGFGDYHYKYESGREGDFFPDRLFSEEAEPVAVHHGGIRLIRRPAGQAGKASQGRVVPVHKQAGGRGYGRSARAGAGVFRAREGQRAEMIALVQESVARAPEPGVEEVPHGVAEHVHTVNHHSQAKTRPKSQGWFHLHEKAPFMAEHTPPAGNVRR